MNIRIVVADQTVARFFDVEREAEEPRLAGQLSDPQGRLHDRDFKSDRPGRKFDRAPLQAGRRGATAHHGVGGGSEPHRREATLFARRIADELTSAHRAGGFDRLVIMAAPAFLGSLRSALSPALRKAVVAEINKDLMHENPSTVRAYVPAQVFQALSSR